MFFFIFYFVENKTFLVREERANRCKIRKVKKATDEHFTLELSLKKTIILSTHNHSLLSLFLLTMKWWPYYFTSPFLSLKMKSTHPPLLNKEYTGSTRKKANTITSSPTFGLAIHNLNKKTTDAILFMPQKVLWNLPLLTVTPPIHHQECIFFLFRFTRRLVSRPPIPPASAGQKSPFPERKKTSCESCI